MDQLNNSMTDDAKSASPEETPGLDQPPEPAPDAEPTPEEVTAELERQRDEYYDLLLRKSAEFDNYRKRVERERRELVDYAAADLLEQILPIVDGLERALQADAGSDDAGAYRQGVEIIYKQLLDLLRKHRVTPLDTGGVDFDPHVHQAVAHEVSTDHRDGEVIAELRRGYLIGDRLLRAAMVKVAKRE